MRFACELARRRTCSRASAPDAPAALDAAATGHRSRGVSRGPRVGNSWLVSSRKRLSGAAQAGALSCRQRGRPIRSLFSCITEPLRNRRCRGSCVGNSWLVSSRRRLSGAARAGALSCRQRGRARVRDRVRLAVSAREPTWMRVWSVACGQLRRTVADRAVGAGRGDRTPELPTAGRWRMQGRAGQDTARRGRAGQGWAGQGRAGQGRAGLGRAGQGWAGRAGRAGQGRAGPGRAGQGRAGQGRARRGRAGPGRAGQGRQCRTGRGRAGSAGPGGAGAGRAGRAAQTTVAAPPARGAATVVR